MPEFTYQGPGERNYTESRDAQGRHLGTVQPGDVRDLDAAPDQWWAPVAGQDGAEVAAAAPEPPADPDGPQPAPPAVIPGA